MRLIPPIIAESTQSDGERAVFEALAAADGRETAGWTVLHSFDIAEHRRRLAGEIDFLCVLPGRGVLVVEVKGTHSLGRRGGDWYYGRSRAPDHRGPFREASDAMHSLRRRVAAERADLAHVPFWSAVCFPFVDFREESPEWNDWQVIDAAALASRPISGLVADVLDHARALLAACGEPWFHPGKAEPTQDQCEALLRLLRPDFEFYESPSARRRRAEDEIRHYTEEQFEALDAIDLNPRIVFEGPAGTGKTLLAIEAARRAVERGRSVLLLCFNRPLGKWLQQEVDVLHPGERAGPGVRARTLHEHLRWLAGIEPTREQRCRQGFWQDELPAMALEELRDARGGGPRAAQLARELYDEIVLDEAQDVLRGSYLDVLDQCLRGGLAGGHWRFFGDFAWQRIYDPGALTADELLAEGWRGTDDAGDGDAQPAAPLAAARCVLRINCRNTPRVAALAVACGEVSPGYARVRRPDDAVEPGILWYDDGEQQLELLRAVLAELRGQGFAGPRVAIISPRGNEACAAAHLRMKPWRDRLAPLVREPGVDEEEAGDWLAACIPSDMDAVNLRSRRISYSSIYRFKGLEAPAVVITDVESLDTAEDRSLLYVGCTRALERLVILADVQLQGRLGA